jgi:hypothetical protein
MLDLMFMLDKFYGELPDSLLQFKATANALFPHVFDNRWILNSNKEVQQTFAANQGYGLEKAYHRVMKQDFKFNQTV